jgi:hypothetical protein
MIIHKLDDETGRVLKTYESAKEAAEDNDCSVSLIRNACIWCTRGTRAKGYRWFATKTLEDRTSYFAEKYNSHRGVTLDNINDLVFRRRKRIKEDMVRSMEVRPETFYMSCGKCNKRSNIKSESMNDRLNLELEGNILTIGCKECGCTANMKVF